MNQKSIDEFKFTMLWYIRLLSETNQPNRQIPINSIRKDSVLDMLMFS